jgi:hypothetical protein
MPAVSDAQLSLEWQTFAALDGPVEVLKLGGDPTVVPVHSDYMRVGVDVALGRYAAPWGESSS